MLVLTLNVIFIKIHIPSHKLEMGYFCIDHGNIRNHKLCPLFLSLSCSPINHVLYRNPSRTYTYILFALFIFPLVSFTLILIGFCRSSYSPSIEYSV